MENLKSLVKSLSTDLPIIDTKVLIDKIKKGATSESLNNIDDLLVLGAETAASLVTHHPNWSTLAGRLLLEHIYRHSTRRFSEFVRANHNVIQPELAEFVACNSQVIDDRIVQARDRDFSFFAIRTLQYSYLLPKECPQYMWMRVALAIHFPDLDRVFETYDLCSRRVFTHATPTLYNSGLKNGQLASCFLMEMHGSSVPDVFETLKECAIISHSVGGIGLHCSNIPSSTAKNNSSSNGNGLVPLLRVFNNASRYISQGGTKRPGAISITLEPWHADILGFLDLRKNHGKEEYRARDLFYALWVPDLFMHKVLNDEPWHLFSPADAPGLQDCYGVEFDKLYNLYVAEEKYVSVIPARAIWDRILDAQIETGNPSLLYKDSCNMKSNQKNLGVIKSSNLCTEIVQYSSTDEIAVCNLASVALPAFVTGQDFDYQKLHKTVKIIVRNLNSVIDRTSYPLPACSRSNFRHRPLAVGVQGLADVFFKLKIAFDSAQASTLNVRIFETVYHACLESSMELAKQMGKTYETYSTSPVSNNILQLDMWEYKGELMWDWDTLRLQIKQFGVYNSLLTAVMPTASTAQILGSIESVEPVMSNIFSRRTISGEFQLINQYLVCELEELGLWTDNMRQQIIAHRGSVQKIHGIPESIKSRYKTAYELSMRAVVDQSVGRAPFIDQSQALNLFLTKPTHRQLTSMHFHAWKKGLKTGIYYLRTMPAADPIPFTISPETLQHAQASQQEAKGEKQGILELGNTEQDSKAKRQKIESACDRRPQRYRRLRIEPVSDIDA